MKKMSMRVFSAIIILAFLYSPLAAQPREQLVKVIVAPDHDNWEYKVRENVKFTISVLQYGNPLKNVKVRYELMPEKMDRVKTDTLTLKEGKITIDGGTMKSPGFLQCWAYATVDGKDYSGFATAGFEPLKIEPTTKQPKDFIEFWEKAKAENAKIPLDAKMTLMPERCTETVSVYNVNLQNFRQGARLYGILCMPKKEGKYPALLRVPGAGARPYGGDTAQAQKGSSPLRLGSTAFRLLWSRISTTK